MISELEEMQLDQYISLMSFQGVYCLKDSVAYGGENKAINIVIDGEELAFSEDDGMGVPFIDSAGRIQVPIRKPLEKIGAAVSFEVDQGSGEKNIIISKGELKINLTVLNQNMRVNADAIYQMDTSPEIRDSRAYMPIRAVFEVLEYSVSWEGASFLLTLILRNLKLPYRRDRRRQRHTLISDLMKSKRVYHCPGWIVNLFNDENGVPRLYYHTEGASMGSPHQFALNTDGSITELNGGREYAGEVYSTGERTFAFRELKFGQDSRLEMKRVRPFSWT